MGDWNWSNLVDPDAWANGLSNTFGVGSGDPANQDREGLRGNASAAGGFASTNAGDYGTLTTQLGAGRGAMNANVANLQALARGQNSVAGEQLRQGLQQNLAAQQSQAAAASPQNAAMAARTAAMQSARLGYGLSGQQAVAGMQERNAAQAQLAQALQAQQQGLLSQRGQDLQGALGGYGAVNQAYGGALGTPQKTPGQIILGGISGGASLATQGGGAAAGGAAMSDRRLKTDVKDGADDAKDALSKLRAFKFRYKDEQHGKGARVGIMAQDLERAGLKHAVIDTPAGKAVHGAHLATALAAMLPGIDKRLAKLEGGKK